MNEKQINIQALALIGDAVFSLYIRTELVRIGITKTKLLQEKSIDYVSAKSQVRILNDLISKKVLTKEEMDIVKRGRNSKKESHPRNTDIVTYKLSTGFEALLGVLYITNKSRLEKILSVIEVKK